MGRRQHGEGSVYHRQDRGQWVAVENLGWRDGKLDRREFTGATPAEAMAKRERFRDRRRDGFTMPKGRQPYVSEWLLHWLWNVARRQVEATTFDRSYKQKVTELIVPYFERVPLPELTEDDIEAWHAELERRTSPRTGRPLSASTIAQAHRIMSRALKAAVARGKLPRNPCQNVSPPAAPRAQVDVPTAGEVARILERCRTWPNGARWVLALKTGLRQGEALALRWPDVKLTAPASVTVRQSAARTAEGLVYKQPKSAKSRRTVPLTAECVAALKAHRSGGALGIQSHPEARGSRRAPGPADDHAAGASSSAEDTRGAAVADIGGLVFTDKGQPVHPRRDYSDWHALLDDLGIRHYRVHDCRHAVATMLLERGVDSRVVQEILGHSSAAFTQQVYQHVNPALQQKALDALDG